MGVMTDAELLAVIAEGRIWFELGCETTIMGANQAHQEGFPAMAIEIHHPQAEQIIGFDRDGLR